jgi:hypothetical protein
MKYGWFWILVDCLFALEALINVCSGEGKADDYIVLFFSLSILLLFLSGKIVEEVKIHKRVKEIK